MQDGSCRSYIGIIITFQRMTSPDRASSAHSPEACASTSLGRPPRTRIRSSGESKNPSHRNWVARFLSSSAGPAPRPF